MASLRLRLVLIPAVILALGLAATIGYEVVGATGRVRAEVGSGMRLGRVLVTAALADVPASGPAGPALTALAAKLPRVRHIEFGIIGGTGPVALAALPHLDLAGAAAPGWFVRLFDLRPRTELFPILQGGARIGDVVMRANPLDEIGEVWGELVWLSAILLAAFAAMIALIHWAVRVALRPLRDLAHGFDRLEHGDYDMRLAPIRVVELARIGTQFNSLACSLGRLSEDNHQLVDALIGLQEAERKQIAHELHDEYGPILFGIRAEATSILGQCRRAEGRLDAVDQRARAIGDLVDRIQRINARILARLRPLALEELGLAEALRELVAAWQDRCPAIRFSVTADDLTLADETMQLALYRVVQECLTNAARHAGARCVEVRVTRRGGAAPEVRVVVRDDGRGIPPGLRFGFGLLGMSERVRALHGRLSIGNGTLGGAEIAVAMPLPAMEPA